MFPLESAFVRKVNDGSSARIVLIPTRISSAPCRNFMPYARAASPVIHFDSPVAVAILPSSVIAALTVTNGRRWTIQWLNASFSRAHSLASASALGPPASRRRVAGLRIEGLAGGTPALPGAVPAIPSRRRFLKAGRECFGFGSVAPITTRLIPAALMASVQGGVRPCVQHGSSVTKSVAPFVEYLRFCASRSASISACRSEERRVGKEC